MNFVHLIYIPFRGVGFDLRDDKWFRERVEIFKNYTLKSLLSQVNRNFTLWISFRPQDKDNPIVAEIGNYLKSVEMPYVFTFEGLMYHDDKFGGFLWHRIKNLGRIIRRCYRNRTLSDLIPTLKDWFYDKNKTLPDRLYRALDTLHDYFGGADTVLMTRIDSDDMFHRDAVEAIQSVARLNSGFEAVVLGDGFIHNVSTGEVSEYNPKTNPPFHTFIFPTKIFFSPASYLRFYRGYRSHEDVDGRFIRFPFNERFYCVTTHNPGSQISTIWNHPFRDNLVNRDILKDFGI